MRVARWAGLLPPSRWDACTRLDRAELIVMYLSESAMEQYEHDHPPKQQKGTPA